MLQSAGRERYRGGRICGKVCRASRSYLCKLLLKHSFLLHHLNHGSRWDALVDLSEKPGAQDSHSFVHGADLGADHSDQVVGCLIAHCLLARVFRQVDASVHHQLKDELFHVEIFLLHNLLLGADRVELKRGEVWRERGAELLTCLGLMG